MKKISFLLIILTFCSFSFSQNKDSLDNQTLIKLYKGLQGGGCLRWYGYGWTERCWIDGSKDCPALERHPKL